MKKIIYILIVGIAVFSSCEKIVMRPNPETTNIAIFNEYAKLVKEKFAMLKYKGVDIDYLRDSIGATITEDLSEDELFEKLAIITIKLRDGHSDLTNDTTVYYDFYSDAPIAYNEKLLQKYYIDVSPDLNKFPADAKEGHAVYYGNLALSDEIGYLRIPGWGFYASLSEIDDIFVAMKNYKAIVVDIRNNPGGDPIIATQFATFFTDTKMYLGSERFKTGPAEGDTAISKLYLNPSESENSIAGKPVIVLTDIWCFSATTTFMYSLAPLENVTFLGWKSGGGAGSVAGGFLANGWQWDLSVSEFIDKDGNHWDEGHEPDIIQVLDKDNPEVDEVLERAFEELK